MSAVFPLSVDNSVAFIPLLGFKTKNRFAKSSKILPEIPDLKLLNPREFSEVAAQEGEIDFRTTLGSLELDFLDESYIVQIPLKNTSAEDAPEALTDLNSILLTFSGNLWCLQDCAVNLDAGYIFSQSITGPTVHKNDVKNHFYNSYGRDREIVPFTFNEVSKAARDAFHSAHTYLESSKIASQKNTRIQGIKRLERFQVWIFDARQKRDLLVRIATYITALEALLSTSQSELSHQLSERVALLCPASIGLPKLDIFLQMKRSYGCRSKALHGSSVKEAQTQHLLELSVFLDRVCRAFLVEIVSSSKFRSHFQNNDSIDELVRKRLFSEQT